jgi:hypothetical protein
MLAFDLPWNSSDGSLGTGLCTYHSIRSVRIHCTLPYIQESGQCCRLLRALYSSHGGDILSSSGNLSHSIAPNMEIVMKDLQLLLTP